MNELPSQIAPLRFSLVREEEKEQKRIKINQRLKPQTNNQTEKGTRGTGRVGEGREERREGGREGGKESSVSFCGQDEVASTDADGQF